MSARVFLCLSSPSRVVFHLISCIASFARERIKVILNLDQSTLLEYKPFSVAVKDGSTFRNATSFAYGTPPLPPAAAVPTMPAMTLDATATAFAPAAK